MLRFSLVAAALFATPVLAQSAATDDALAPRPAAFAAGADAPDAVSADTPLTDEQIARRVARLYQRQADLLQADADGDEARYTTLLDDLLTDLNVLAQRPGILSDDRFREVYSSALTEYERFYERPALDRGDIYAFRAAAMEAVEPSFATGTPLLEHVDLPKASTFPTTIPMDVNAKVEKYITFLLKRPSHVNRLRQRSDTYLPMIERILAEEGVPDELKYLAMVESALVPAARSHAGAAGMWQFISATGRAYGLKAESERDDRLDPELATRAAARHLRDLYDRFGDWQLALAGYNCNPAVIARAKRRFERDNDRPATFWDIDHAIPRETRAYVPMFIATALVVSNPDAYGVPPHEPGPRYVFDRVPVAGGTRLSDVARLIDADESVLRALNPSLRKGRVPTVRVPHMLRVPVGAYAENQAALDRLAPPEANPVQFAAETVLYGTQSVRPLEPLADSPALLAAAETSARARATTRPTPPSADRPAARLLAQSAPAVRQPSPARSSFAAPRTAQPETDAPAERQPEPVAAADPTPVTPASSPAVDAPQFDASASSPAPALVAQAPAPEPKKQADAPSDDGASIAALIRDEAPASADDDSTPAPVLSEAPAPPVRVVRAPAEPRRTVHTVRRGEYLLKIANQYGVSLSQLRAWNGLSSDTVRPGQKIRVVAGSAPARRAEPRETVHKVRSGENLTRIARTYGVTVTQIKEWNRLSSETIRVGQRLTIKRRTVRG